LDNAVQNNMAAKATVATAEAQIRTAEAAVETAKINLDFTRLASPIDGIAGQAQLPVGALVNLSSGTVTSVSTVDPIKVYFTVGEPQCLAWRKRYPTETSRQAADKNLHRELILADGSTYAHEGQNGELASRHPFPILPRFNLSDSLDKVQAQLIRHTLEVSASWFGLSDHEAHWRLVFRSSLSILVLSL
jgi:multidrug efflux pump subunit AcrA (membrane-fusion protein)